MNRGLDACSAALIARMDADDISYPLRLRQQIDYLNANADIALVGGQMRRIGNVRAGTRTHLPTDHDVIVRELLAGQHALCHPTIMFRRSTAVDAGGYWNNGFAEDWDFYLKIAERARLANLSAVVLDYRFHSDSINGSRMTEVRNKILYASDCAKRRAAGKAALPYGTFTTSARCTLTRRVKAYADVRSQTSYRRGMTKSLNGSPVAGAFLLGPATAWRRPDLSGGPAGRYRI